MYVNVYHHSHTIVWNTREFCPMAVAVRSIAYAREAMRISTVATVSIIELLDAYSFRTAGSRQAVLVVVTKSTYDPFGLANFPVAKKNHRRIRYLRRNLRFRPSPGTRTKCTFRFDNLPETRTRCHFPTPQRIVFQLWYPRSTSRSTIQCRSCRSRHTVAHRPNTRGAHLCRSHNAIAMVVRGT